MQTADGGGASPPDKKDFSSWAIIPTMSAWQVRQYITSAGVAHPHRTCPFTEFLTGVGDIH
jgi:hypothetical protein